MSTEPEQAETPETPETPDLAATLFAALAALDVQAAEAAVKHDAAEVEWKEGKVEVARQQTARCDLLAENGRWGKRGYGNEAVRAGIDSSLQAACDRCDDAAETRREQAEVLWLLEKARYHITQARGLVGLVAARTEVFA